MVGKLFDCYAAPFGVAIESSRTQTIVISFGSHVFSGTASPLAEALLFLIGLTLTDSGKC